MNVYYIYIPEMHCLQNCNLLIGIFILLDICCSYTLGFLPQEELNKDDEKILVR